MQTLLTAFGSFSPFFQLFTIVLLCVIFWEPIAQRVFNYTPKKNDDIRNLPDRLLPSGARDLESKQWFDGILEIVQQQGKQLEIISGAMGELSAHYNHETTGLLSEIRDNVVLLARKHDEWEKYGIPTRECKEKMRV